MGVTSYELELTSSLPAAKLYKAMVLDADIILPKIMPQAFESVEIIQGDGGPGTIKKVTFGQGRSNFKYMKDKIEAIDKENLTFSHSVIEGDLLRNVLEKITYDIKLEPSSNGGCTIRETSKYYTIDDSEISADELKAGKEKALGMFKAMEAYILSNPDA